MFRSFIGLGLVVFLSCPCHAQPPVEVVGNPERVCATHGEADSGFPCEALPEPQNLPPIVSATLRPKGFQHPEIVAGVDEEWGAGFYVLSEDPKFPGAPYLAFAPPGGLQFPQSWRFFTGRGLSGSVNWVELGRWQTHTASDGAWDPGTHARLFTESSACGGFQIEWNAQLARFLMLYGCDDGKTYVRVAQHASGPWSEATALLSGPMIAPHLLAQYTTAGPPTPGSRSTIVVWEASSERTAPREIYRSTLRQVGAE